MDELDCINPPDSFCYICGEFVLQRLKRSITTKVCEVYRHYFHIDLVDQDKSWAPHIACNRCVDILFKWMNGKYDSGLPFSIPMIWLEPMNHPNDCYFCLTTELNGYNLNNMKLINYPDKSSSHRPLLRDSEEPATCPPVLSSCGSSVTKSIHDTTFWTEAETVTETNHPHLISQEDLNNLVKDLDLPKYKSELLGSRLQQWNLLEPSVNITAYRHRHKDISSYFSMDGNLCYCHDILSLMEHLSKSSTYVTEEWRLFIDSGKTH